MITANYKPTREVDNQTQQYISCYGLFRNDQKSKKVISMTEELLESKNAILSNSVGFNELVCRLTVEYSDEVVIYKIKQGDYKTFSPHIESYQGKMNCLSYENKRKAFFVDGLMCISFNYLSYEELRKMMLNYVVRCIKKYNGDDICVCENRKTHSEYHSWGYYCSEMEWKITH